jgi:hypothetical protein
MMRVIANPKLSREAVMVGNVFLPMRTTHKLFNRTPTQTIQSFTGLGGFLCVPFGYFLVGKTALSTS